MGTATRQGADTESLPSVGDASADAGQSRWIEAPPGHPYYIVAPSYTRMSAGVRVMHLLCHALNRIGQRAYIWIDPIGRGERNPDLLTPLLNLQLIRLHRERGQTPIVVYPETVRGNPLGAPLVVRYILNFPGLLGGDREYPEDEIKIAYSGKLAAAAGIAKEDVLFVPASDAHTFRPGPTGRRQGSCYFASKYREAHGGELFDVTRDSVEITRFRKDSPTPQQLAELFRRSEVFYAYENTALAIEALLCECPTVFLPNPYLTDAIAADELGWDGMAWGTDPAEVRRAKETVHRGRQNYLRHYDAFWDQLDRFVAVTQERARRVPYAGLIGPTPLKYFLMQFGAFRKPTRLVKLAGAAVLLYLLVRFLP